MIRTNSNLSLVLSLAFFVTACDGGGGEGDTGAAASSDPMMTSADASGTTMTDAGTTSAGGTTSVGTASTGSDECGWWCDDTGESGVTGGDDKGGDDKGGDDKGGDDKGDDLAFDLWYGKAIDVTSGMGTFGRYRAGQPDGATCIVTYDYQPVAADDCEACTFAWKLTLGVAKVDDASGCNGDDALQGQVVGYGHAEDGRLFIASKTGWVAIDDPAAKSTVTGTAWGFSHPPHK